MVDQSSSTVHSQKLGKTRLGHDEGYHLDPIYIQSHCIRSVLSSLISSNRRETDNKEEEMECMGETGLP